MIIVSEPSQDLQGLVEGMIIDAMRRDMEDSGEIPSARRRPRSTDPKPKVIAWDQSVMDKITADSNIAKPRS